MDTEGVHPWDSVQSVFVRVLSGRMELGDYELGMEHGRTRMGRMGIERVRDVAGMASGW
jgi:hypothetical protein